MDEWGVWRFGRSIQGVSVLPIFVEEGVEERWAKPTCGVSRSVFSIELEYERVDTSSKVGVGIILLRFHPGKSRPRAKLDENRNTMEHLKTEDEVEVVVQVAANKEQDPPEPTDTATTTTTTSTTVTT